MRSVNRKVFLFLAGALLWALPVQAAEQIDGKTFYTTANIWYDWPDRIESTNYHKGTILPIGTKVKIAEVNDGTKMVFSGNLDPEIWALSIRFADESGKPYKILYISRHGSAGTSIWDFFKRYFSEKDPMAEGGAFAALSAEEQKKVKAGEIEAGMSKTAVVMAYGYPPGHKTPSLDLDKWVYWVNRFKTRTVYFRDNKVRPEPQPLEKVSSIDECIRACKENTNRTPEQCFDACRPQ